MLFKVTGSDTLGVVAKFSRVLADHGAQIMDVDQSACTIHSTFTLDLLARCPAGDVIQDMLTTAKDMEVNLEVVALEASTMRSDGSPGMRYKLTLFNRGLSFESLAQVSEAAAQAGLSIERLDRLTPLDVPVAARPPTALRIVLEEGGTPGGESTSDISEFVQALRFVQDDLDCHLLLEEHHVPGRPGFSEDVIENVHRKDLLLKLSPRSSRNMGTVEEELEKLKAS